MNKLINILKPLILICAVFGWLTLVAVNNQNIFSIVVAIIALGFFLEEGDNKFYKPSEVYTWAKIISHVIIVCLAIYPFVVIKNATKIEQISGYVYAFPNKDNDKNYRLVADMTKTGNHIFVNKIYFYNGGSINFDESYNREESESNDDAYIKVGDKSCTPHYNKNDGKEWCIRYFGEEIKGNESINTIDINIENDDTDSPDSFF